MNPMLLQPRMLQTVHGPVGEVLPAGYERRDPLHPLRIPQDYLPDGSRTRNWSVPERKFRLTYRRYPLLTLLCTAVILMGNSAVAWGAPRVGSIYAASPFAGSGWANCAPIAWTTDTHNLSAPQAELVRNELTAAFATWAQVSSLSFTYAGNGPVLFSDATSSVEPVNDLRHSIAVAFVPDSQSSMLTKSVVGFGSPNKVFADSKEIVGGYVVVSSDFLRWSRSRARLAIFTHEIGHALGLAHSEDSNSIMFPYPRESRGLDSGDIEGIRALTKICGT